MSQTMDLASVIKFSDFCIVLKNISKSQGFAARKKKVTQFIQDWRGTSSQSDFFPALRLLLPEVASL
jgi:hypothetical protein